MHESVRSRTVDRRGKDGSLHGFYDSKQFLPGHTVVSFWSGQTLAKVGDDTLLPSISWTTQPRCSYDLHLYPE
ncbi:hypothetical protein TNCT_451481 [Trichonephila clavata]|uniref:Uncharacterized protein n=1 Tax=Trichonephila clavata TaxID=2740835 RepID=A0A8X6L1L0_TRICU|nr:hypothetical protein TNCT_451481 [Trichonephila clavata]